MKVIKPIFNLVETIRLITRIYFLMVHFENHLCIIEKILRNFKNSIAIQILISETI